MKPWVDPFHADPAISPIAHQVAWGMTGVGLLPKRDGDVAGFRCSFAGVSRANGSTFTGNEVNLEGFYRFQVTRWIGIQPDLQWIWHPGGDSRRDGALVATVRMTMKF